MSTKQFLSTVKLGKEAYFSSIRTTIETAAYGNNIYPVETVKEA